MENPISKNKIQIVILGFIIFVLVIVLCLNLSSLPENNPKVDTLNYNTTAETLSERNLANLEQSFAIFAAATYPEAYEQNPKFTISVRPDTLKKYQTGSGEEASFIIDVEEIKMTYNVQMSLMDRAIAVFTCPSPGFMKYEGQTCLDRQEAEEIITNELTEE